LASVVLVSGGLACGIPDDGQPTLLPGGVVEPALAPSEPVQSPLAEVAVFLVQAEHLVPVARRAAPADVTGVLGRLLAGPRQEEFATGVRTAISPQTELRSARLSGETATLDLTAALVEVGGEEQILAVAQIVLTATALPGVTGVRLLLEGQAVEIPRADGTLTSDILRAKDYEALLKPAP
jgi:spore germination protein GerM